MSLLQMSFSAGVMILVVIVLRAMVLHTLPKKTFMALWALVLLRLLLPISIPSSFSIYSWWPSNPVQIYEGSGQSPPQEALKTPRAEEGEKFNLVPARPVQPIRTGLPINWPLTLCIHWFNPMVWLMFILFNRDIELNCDETVIRSLGENNKSAYAYILIDMESQKIGHMPLCTYFNKNAI